MRKAVRKSRHKHSFCHRGAGLTLIDRKNLKIMDKRISRMRRSLIVFTACFLLITDELNKWKAKVIILWRAREYWLLKRKRERLLSIDRGLLGTRTIKREKPTFDNIRERLSVYPSLRFNFRHLKELYDELEFPNEYVSEHGHKFTGEEIFFIGLHNMANGGKLQDKVEHLWGRSDTAISVAQRYFINHVYNKFARKLETDAHLQSFAHEFPEYSKRVKKRCRYRSGGKEGFKFPKSLRPFAFLDCTMHATARPGSGPPTEGASERCWRAWWGDQRNAAYLIQRSFYTAYGKMHGVKSQAAVAPTGIFISIHSPVSARQNDLTVCRRSRILDLLEDICDDMLDGETYHLLGDSAYRTCGSRCMIATNYGEKNFTDNLKNDPAWRYLFRRWAQQTRALNSARVTVENAFAGVYNNWKVLRVIEKIKIMHVNCRANNNWVKQIFPVAFFLQNCKVCLEGNQVSNYFDMTGHTTLQDYIDKLDGIN